jgi:hypothetical protein
VITVVFLVVTVIENLYLVFAATSWWIVLRAYSVMKEADALSAGTGHRTGGQFGHQRFDQRHGTIASTVGSDAGSTISSGDGGGIVNPAFKTVGESAGVFGQP